MIQEWLIDAVANVVKLEIWLVSRLVSANGYVSLSISLLTFLNISFNSYNLFCINSISYLMF